MYEGETREIEDAAVVADLLKAGYIEEVKPEPADADAAAETEPVEEPADDSEEPAAEPKRGRSVKKSGEPNPQE